MTRSIHTLCCIFSLYLYICHSVSLYGILFLSVAMSAIERQCSQEAAFFHTQEGPMFNGLRSNSMALSHMWLGLPGSRFQSDGGLRITAATA